MLLTKLNIHSSSHSVLMSETLFTSRRKYVEQAGETRGIRLGMIGAVEESTV